jgi:hypothetical protein
MKGDDEVWYGVITAEKRSRLHSPDRTTGENSVMNAGCHPTIRVRISGCGRKTPPLYRVLVQQRGYICRANETKNLSLAPIEKYLLFHVPEFLPSGIPTRG